MYKIGVIAVSFLYGLYFIYFRRLLTFFFIFFLGNNTLFNQGYTVFLQFAVY